jgi:TonB family protein
MRRSSAAETRRESADQYLPRGLERSDIAAGMATIQDSGAACGAGHLAKGTVTVSIKVGGDGKVAGARVASSPNEELGSCVASKVRRASFARTQNGATFTYPFIFK